MALTPVIVGCGADCEDVCEKANDECDEDNDCSDQCSKLEDLAEEADCTDEFDDFISCSDDADDICGPDPEDPDYEEKVKDQACYSELMSYATCVGKYCAANPTDAACDLD